MTCTACQSSNSGRINADCQDCRIRDLARGPMFFATMKSGRMTDSYKAAIRAEFGLHWREGHERVKAAYAALVSGVSA